MKAKYIKPSITEDLLLSDEDFMLVVSGDGKPIVEEGGSTSGSGVTEGDSRPFKVWSDDED